MRKRKRPTRPLRKSNKNRAIGKWSKTLPKWIPVLLLKKKAKISNWSLKQTSKVRSTPAKQGSLFRGLRGFLRE